MFKTEIISAKRRLQYLFDVGTFTEMYGDLETANSGEIFPVKKFPGDGVIVGFGKVCGRLVFASSEDVTVNGGSLGKIHGEKICAVLDKAIELGAPMVFINDGGGARIEEGIIPLIEYGELFKRQVLASGKILQLSLILGTCAGGACYGPALSDFILTVEGVSKMFITGPKVVQTVTHEKVTGEELGGSEVLNKVSGVAHFVFKNEIECILETRKLIEIILSKNKIELKEEIGKRQFEKLVPLDGKKTYDIKKVLYDICDENTFIEIQKYYACNIVIGLGKLYGKTIGIVANQPIVKCGVLDCNSSKKITRFIEFCSRFKIPIITLVDVPAFMPGKDEEHNGIIWEGSRVIYAYVKANVPKVSVILRKAYGGAYIALNSIGLGADFVYAWPNAEIAVMGAEGAAEILASKYVDKRTFIEQYQKHYLNATYSARKGGVTSVIDPNETRKRLGIAMETLENYSDNTI